MEQWLTGAGVSGLSSSHISPAVSKTTLLFINPLLPVRWKSLSGSVATVTAMIHRRFVSSVADEEAFT